MRHLAQHYTAALVDDAHRNCAELWSLCRWGVQVYNLLKHEGIFIGASSALNAVAAGTVTHTHTTHTAVAPCAPFITCKLFILCGVASC